MERRSTQIRVKFIARGLMGSTSRWRRQLPDAAPQWDDCLFLFDPAERHYDWLVAYNDLPTLLGERTSQECEPLACPPENTILVTGEPSSITVYGTDFLAQFGRVLSSQEKWAIRHNHLVASPPLWCWFYGTGGEKVRGLDELREQTIPVKTETISTVCSTKRHAHTWHRGRLDFVEYLKNQLPELAVFGRGYQPVADKATALDSFRYHVVCENAVSLNHWTEKLADAYLGYCLPFYFGCPNVADYFPPESFIPINIADHQSALETVRRAIANNEYERRLPYIQEARCRVLDQYNIFPAIVREIHKPAHGTAYKPRGATIYSRHALRRRPLPALRLAWEKAQRKLFIQLPSAKKV